MYQLKVCIQNYIVGVVTRVELMMNHITVVVSSRLLLGEQ